MCRSLRLCPRWFPAALILPLLALAPISAATAGDFEPYVFAGYQETEVDFRTGIACVTLVGVECPTEASTEGGDDEVFGIGLAARIAGPWWVDLRYSEQETEARFFDSGVPVSIPPPSFDLSQLHLGALYRFREGRWSPFLTAFAGVTFVESEASTVEQGEIDLDRPSGGVGAGLLVDLGSRLGLRFEVRGTRTDLGGEFEEDLDQIQASAGLRLRI